MVSENPATLQENQERRALPYFPANQLFGLKNVGFNLKTSDCPSPTLTAQPESGQLMPSTSFIEQGLWSVRDP